MCSYINVILDMSHICIHQGTLAARATSRDDAKGMARLHAKEELTVEMKEKDSALLRAQVS